MVNSIPIGVCHAFAALQILDGQSDTGVMCSRMMDVSTRAPVRIHLEIFNVYVSVSCSNLTDIRAVFSADFHC